MAFRKKAELILSYNPDILIVPECEHPDKLKFPQSVKQPSDILWYGSNLNKGLGVFSYSNYKFRLLDIHNPEIKTILPIEVTGGKFPFIMFAIWANNTSDLDNQYVGQIWKALTYYEKIIENQNVILIGDFNSNSIWDKKHQNVNHSKVVEKLTSNDIVSSYHYYFNQIQGKERHPTFSLYRHKDKPYHIDYCFVSGNLVRKLTNVEVGLYENWHSLSDHKPLIVTFDL